MYSNLFSAQSVQDLMSVLPSLPFAIWETFYVTVVSTALSLVLGLPLGVLLVAGEKNGVLPLPRPVMTVLNFIINILRSLPSAHRHRRGHHGHHRSAGGGGVPLCGTSGGEQSPRGGW